MRKHMVDQVPSEALQAGRPSHVHMTETGDPRMRLVGIDVQAANRGYRGSVRDYEQGFSWSVKPILS